MERQKKSIGKLKGQRKEPVGLGCISKDGSLSFARYNCTMYGIGCASALLSSEDTLRENQVLQATGVSIHSGLHWMSRSSLKPGTVNEKSSSGFPISESLKALSAKARAGRPITGQKIGVSRRTASTRLADGARSTAFYSACPSCGTHKYIFSFGIVT